jgi:hypothetical protein
MNGGKHLEITLRSVHNFVSVGPSNMLGLSYQVAQLKPIFLNIQSNDARDLLETKLPEFKPIPDERPVFSEAAHSEGYPMM